MSYKLGTIDQFRLEDAKVKKSKGWTDKEIMEGKVISSEDYETRITTLLSKKQNPNGSDQYLWESESGDIEDDYNILASWGIMSKPTFDKYYIANNNGSYIYGKATPSSWPIFGALVTDIKIFDDEGEFLSKAKELNITIEEF